MPICVLGMHRSGTSMMMQMLGKCGVYLGDDKRTSRPGDHDNPLGYWENPSFRKLNDRILSTLGGDWKIPPYLSQGWQVEDERVAPMKEEAHALVSKMDRHALWGWKDPRNSLTLPFWRSIVPDLKCVILVRNPVQVAQSLQSRIDQGPPRSDYGLEFYDALALWGLYYRQILSDLNDDDTFVVVHYESLLTRPLVELRRIDETLQLDLDPEKMKRAAEIPDPALFRSLAPAERLNSPENAPVRFAYEDMCQMAGPAYKALRVDQTYWSPRLTPKPDTPGADNSERNRPAPAGSAPAGTRYTLDDVDIVIVHYRETRATVAMLNALFSQYPEICVTVVDNSGGTASFKEHVLPYLPEFREQIRLLVNPGTTHGKGAELSHGAGIDLARKNCTRPFMLSMETDTFVLDRGCLEYALGLREEGYDWAGNAQKPIDGGFASFSPSFAIFRVSLLDQYDLSFRVRQRPEEEMEASDPLIRHHRRAAKRVEEGLPLEYPEGKAPDTYRRSREKIVETELQHLSYFDTGEWVHAFLTRKGHSGHLFTLPDSLRHTWGSRDEGIFVRNFHESLPDVDLNRFLPPSLQFATDLKPLDLACLSLLREDVLAPAPHWHWLSDPPGRLSVESGQLQLELEHEEEKIYYGIGADEFKLPPPEEIAANIAPCSLHRLFCDCRISNSITARMYLIEYDSQNRLATQSVLMKEGTTELDFITSEKTRSFRVLFWLSGRGTVTISRLGLLGGG